MNKKRTLVGGLFVQTLCAALLVAGIASTPALAVDGACCKAMDNSCTQVTEAACKALGKGFTYRGDGTPCGSDGTCIPTLSEWGVAVMAMLVLTAGTIVVMRRRAAATT